VSVVSIWCDESNALPLRTALELDRGEMFRVLYLPSDDGRDDVLRHIVIRRAADTRMPFDAQALFWGRVPRTGPIRLEVTRTGPEHRQSLFVDEGQLTRLVVDEDRLHSGARLKLERLSASSGESAPPIQFTLGFDAVHDIGLASAVGSADPDLSLDEVRAEKRGWKLPTVRTAATQPLRDLQKQWRLIAAKATAWRGAFLSFMPYVMVGGVGVGLYYFGRGDAGKDAQIAEITAELERTKDALAVAVGAEDECLEDRKDLSSKLGDRGLMVEAAAASAVAVGASQREAVANGKAELIGEAVEAWDGAYGDNLLAAVRDRAMSRESIPERDDLQRCMRFDEHLNSTLPSWTLLWAIDPKLRCTPQDESVVEGVPLYGRWLLSEWLAWEFGPAGAAEAGAGLSDDRRSIETLTRGMRVVRRDMLQAYTDGRPQVAPSQSDAWTSTFLMALDLMPVSEVYESSSSPSMCVRALVEDIAAAAERPAVGAPVLPDLVEVAAGMEIPGVGPTPDCPWSGVALSIAASATIDAMATQTLLELDETANK